MSLASELQMLRAEHSQLVASQQAALAKTRRDHADAVAALQAQHTKDVTELEEWVANEQRQGVAQSRKMQAIIDELEQARNRVAGT
jgi:hypothetical protein